MHVPVVSLMLVLPAEVKLEIQLIFPIIEVFGRISKGQNIRYFDYG
jgi:hypothetical protein